MLLVILTQMLRTCSEPDLSKLFRTVLSDNPFFKEEVHASLDLPSMEESDEDEEEEGEDGDEGPEEGQDVSFLFAYLKKKLIYK